MSSPLAMFCLLLCLLWMLSDVSRYFISLIYNKTFPLTIPRIGHVGSFFTPTHLHRSGAETLTYKAPFDTGAPLHLPLSAEPGREAHV